MHPHRQFGKTQARAGNVPTRRAIISGRAAGCHTDDSRPITGRMIISRHMRARPSEVASCARRPFLHRDIGAAALPARYAAQLTPRREAAA